MNATLCDTPPSHYSHRFAFLGLLALSLATASAADFLLPRDTFRPHVARFNAADPETVTNHIPNAAAADWLAAHAPRFECPDAEVTEIWHFRWWTFRKHLRQTPAGFVITEFLPPVKHAGAHNTISCAAGFHLAEGRWLRDPQLLDDYTRFWLRGAEKKPPPHFHKFSSWFAAAVWDRACVTGDFASALGLLDELVADYRLWETERCLPSGLFWQHDVKDGMEESISGSRTAQQPRPTINSYMVANARAISALATRAGRADLAKEFTAKADALHRLMLAKLWDDEAKFFKVLRASGEFSSAREAIGYVPWMFNLPDARHAAAWTQLIDPAGFQAPFGLTTAERRHPQFRTHGTGKCEWDGPVWPFATSQTLLALANFLRASSSLAPTGGAETAATRLPTRSDYFSAFLTYTRSHRFKGQPYIGEYLDEVTGAWLKGNHDRSRHYNHSLYADLVITGLVGLRPRADDTIEIHPLLPDGTWDWFALDGLPYHGRTLTILWDKTGARYGKGAGLRVFADGKLLAETNRLTRVTATLPAK